MTTPTEATALVGEPFDVFAAPLAGFLAIEASAGTGKTYAITQLYLRLVVEAGLAPHEILVVSFTKAATAELRTRLRGQLVTTRDAFRDGRTRDAFASELLGRHADGASALARIERALHGFDEAAVFTIHGFCQRVLAERAFESGVPFDVELVPDQQRFVEEVVDDEWRRALYGASPLYVRWVLEQARTTPETLALLVQAHAARPYRRVDGPADPGDTAALEREFLAACGDLRAQWARDGAEVVRRLVGNPALKQNVYPAGAIARCGQALELALAEDPPSPASFEALA